jgi:hypothetical protein
MRFRFVQISDLHLGGGVSVALGLDAAKAGALRAAPLEALAAACSAARSESAEAVLIPGDLFDAESADADTINNAVGLLNDIAPLPVFIAPGNHDFFSRDGYYSREFLAARRRTVWGPHVHIFDEPRLRAVTLMEHPGVSITGSCFTGNVPATERALGRPMRVDPSRLNVLLLHGSREGHARGAGARETCPFSDAELLAQPFDYTALGHYHAHAEVRDASGIVRAAYAGAPQGRGLDETGEKGALLVTVSREEGSRSVEARFLPLARHRILAFDLDVTGLGHAAALASAAEALCRDAGVRADTDLLCFALHGRWPRGATPEFTPEFARRFFHLAVDASSVVPDYDVEGYRRSADPTMDAVFARHLCERIEAEEDPARRRLLRNALYYGLDALLEGRVTPRYER